MSDFVLHPEKITIFGEFAHNKIANNTLGNRVKKIVDIYNLKNSEFELQRDEEMVIACVGKNFELDVLRRWLIF